MSGETYINDKILLSQISALSARVGIIEGGIHVLMDDFPEDEESRAPSSGGVWSGWLWYLGTPTQVLDTATASPTGIYLKVKLSDGTTSYVDEITSPSDTDEYNYYVVATRTEESGDPPDYTYTLNNRTCGDIHIDVVPWLPEAES